MSNFPNNLINEESYKDLFDNAHDLIQLVQLDGSVMYVNNAWMRVLGYSLEEIQKRSIYSFVAEEDREWFKSYRQEIINGAIHEREITVRFVSKSEKTVFLEGFISLRKQQDKPYYTRGIFRDITAKVDNEVQVKERERNLQQLLFNAPDAIIVINTDSLITLWNPMAEKIFGYSVDEVINQPLSHKIIPPEYREAHEKGMRRFLATGETRVLNQTIEITAINKAGEQFYVSLTISTTRQNGQPAFIAFLRDIREQKKNAAELDKKRAELEESNQQLEQFAHVASHDMKEPIRKIRFFSDMLKIELTGKSSEKLDTYLGKINSAADRLFNMVDGVLNYASSATASTSFERVELNEILKSIETDLEVIIEQKKAIINYKALPELYGDHFLIYQLFYNLINNSLKFSNVNVDPVISITSRQVDEAGKTPRKFTEVKIKDNGIGFKQENAQNIFKTFIRLHNRSEFEGTGLGLSLCKNIMERHNGSIVAEGIPGEGATFTLFFPLVP